MITPEQAIRALTKRRKDIDRFVESIARRRWKPSEKAMAQAEYKMEQEAIDLAITLVKQEQSTAEAKEQFSQLNIPTWLRR